MEKKRDKITEARFRELIDETVSDVLKRIGLVNEMAVSLKHYRARVDGLRFLLVENWCLCKWCQIFNPKSNNFSHWIGELKACINNLKYLNIKNRIDKKGILTRMLVADYDYNDTNMILRIVNDKFDSENITNENQRERVASEFAENIGGLIDVISVNANKTKSYIERTFQR